MKGSCRVLCIIPARGGSKRLPQKNLLRLCGKPLIAHTIEHARGARRVCRVVVSTDNPEIARVSRDCGAEVIVRPLQLSGDKASSESALLHVLEELGKEGYRPELVVFLQCTSPVRTSQDIDRAVDMLLRGRADSLFSACRNERFLWRRIGKRLKPLNYDYRARPRDQDHPQEYRENGSIYVFRPEILERHGCRLGGKIAVYEMDYWSSFQVDALEHLGLCEWILERRNQSARLEVPNGRRARTPCHS